MIPHHLGNLTSLRFLSLEASPLYVEDLRWLFGLSSLVYLFMSNVNLSQASDHWVQAINMLPSLLELDLSFCELNHIGSLPFVNFTSLTILNLDSNHFHSPIPDWVFSLSNLLSLNLQHSEFLGPFPNVPWSFTSLTTLDVSNNNLSSTIPNSLYGMTNLTYIYLGSNNLRGGISSAIQNLTSLVSLGLSDNMLEGKIPFMGNICSVEALVLGSNKFVGTVSETFEILSGCLANNLKSLNLDDNFFTGQIMDQIGEFKNLVDLSLRGNMISGSIPMSLGTQLSVLEFLDVSDNRLNGSLPKSLGSLSNLQQLFTSGNLLEGTVSEAHFANLTNLIVFHGSGNSLALRVRPDWIPPFNLFDIRLRSWNLGPQFPALWLKSQKQIQVVDLSNTGISDSIPSWFSNFPDYFSTMNLSHNQIYGKIPDILNVPDRASIYLSSNKLTGPLPRISSALSVLDLSNNPISGELSRLLCNPTGVENSLAILGLGKTLLSGRIPDCWMHWKSLAVIDLGSNGLSGEIPSSFGSLRSLESLHLRNNNLSGEIPLSLVNCTKLSVIDFGLNKIIGRIPNWIGIGLQKLVFFGARSNKLKGQIPRELCDVTALQILDVADNNLSGTIPDCFGDFKAMATKPQQEEPIMVSLFSFALYLENAFVVTKGREDQYSTILRLLTSLDLSQNNLSGEIPKQLTSLQGLVSLNLSGNRLRGSIPDKIGDLSWILSLDISRNQLSGELPSSLSELSFLSHLNVSYNNFSGEIPLSTQLQSMEASSFIGNQLCGPPLPKRCRDEDHNTTGGDADGEEEAEEEDEYWFRLGVAVGFGVGFLGIIGPLVFCRFWRRAYFWFIQEYIWYKILDCFIKLKYMLIKP
ncbi:LRR domain containing protein [Trema orientale]|uniref:LRR domain containing protein n=1 Tax=Trema orientale TaxID=63057 RepID=A0A2P5FGJ9_TREOI|nr:LRR domain containing protein [Trema orientale]